MLVPSFLALAVFPSPFFGLVFSPILLRIFSFANVAFRYHIQFFYDCNILSRSLLSPPFTPQFSLISPPFTLLPISRLSTFYTSPLSLLFLRPSLFLVLPSYAVLPLGHSPVTLFACFLVSSSCFGLPLGILPRGRGRQESP